MSVYVDWLCKHGWKMRGRTVESCHLLADTLDELHDFAQKIGLKRSWFQNGSAPHYDLTASRRIEAVKAGAIELTRATFPEVYRRAKMSRITIEDRQEIAKFKDHLGDVAGGKDPLLAYAERYGEVVFDATNKDKE